MEIYEVGGAVRDALLGETVSERDWVVVGGSAETLLRLGYQQVGRDFPVFLHPESKDEYALARTERKVAAGHTGFEVNAASTVTLEADLERRDLTINAIARDTAGNLIDPYGGRKDLDDRVLRHLSPAFREDPLRVLRTARFAARFHALGFSVADETLALMRAIGEDGELEALPAERVWAETLKALSTDRPDVFIEVLRDCGALQLIFPEVDKLFGVPQTARWHPEIDTGIHTLMALHQAALISDDPIVRFAVLVHDLGKGATPADILPSHHGHEARSVTLLLQLCARLRVPKRFQTQAVHVARHHGSVHRANELKPSTTHDILAAIGALSDPARLDGFLAACEADARGRKGLEDRPYPQAQLFRQSLEAALAITADMVSNPKLEGPAFGAELRRLRIENIRG